MKRFIIPTVAAAAGVAWALGLVAQRGSGRLVAAYLLISALMVAVARVR